MFVFIIKFNFSIFISIFSKKLKMKKIEGITSNYIGKISLLEINA